MQKIWSALRNGNIEGAAKAFFEPENIDLSFRFNNELSRLIRFTRGKARLSLAETILCSCPAEEGHNHAFILSDGSYTPVFWKICANSEEETCEKVAKLIVWYIEKYPEQRQKFQVLIDCCKKGFGGMYEGEAGVYQKAGFVNTL